MLAPLLFVLVSQSPVTLQDPNTTARAKVVTTSGGALQVSCVGGTCSGGGGGGGSVGDGGYTVVIQGTRLDAGAAWEVFAAALPLPSGAATSANQTTLGSQTTKLNDGTDTALISAGGALLIDGTATVQPVSGTVTANQGGAPWSLNQTQWNGVAVSVGAGASGTGTVRVMLASDSALAANQSVNTAQVNGAAVNVGTGAAGTGTQRVAVASDSAITANAGTNLNTSSLALSATQTDRTQKAQVTDGTRDGTVKAASTAAIATDTSLVVAVSPNSPLPTGANVIGHVIADTGSTTAVTGNVTAVQATGTNLHVVTDATSVLAANQSVNVSQVNGVTTSTGIGASGTGSIRTASLVHDGTTAAGVIAATTALKTDTSSIAGTATSTGVGASGAGVQRIAALIHDGTDTLLISAGGAALVDGTATTQPVSISAANFPDNEPFNVAQINGVTPLMGVGASGTGALRTASLIHDGTTVAGVIAGTTALKTDTSSVAGTATSTGVGASGAGVQRVASLIHDGTNTAAVKAASTAAATTDTALVVGVSPNGGNPCQNPSATLVGIAGATSGTAAVQLVALSGSTKIYICSVNITGVSGTTPTFSLKYGTGSACATGGVTILGAWTTAANTVYTFYEPFVTPAGQALCYVDTGTSPVQNYAIAYVQQ